MNIGFIVPPVLVGNLPAERSSGCTHVVYPTPNIYELTVAGYLISKGYNISYIDCVNIPCGIDQLISKLKKDNIDTCTIWTVNLSIENDKQVAKILTENIPDLRIIFMGPGSTYYTKEMISSDNSFVVRGEPEVTLEELLHHLDSNLPLDDIKGISYLKDNKITHNPSRELMKDLDCLPIPARHLVEDITFRNAKLKTTPYTTMVTSRNCPFHCIYCVPSSLTFAREIEYRKDYGKKPPISFRSVEKIDEEIRYLAEKGYKAIGFMDDNFIWTEKRTQAICKSLKEHHIVWGCQARVDAITEPIAKMLSESGCRYIDLGIESFDNEILKYIHKGITNDQIYNAIHLLKKYHVPVKLNLLIGTSPLETKETIRHSIREAKRLKVDQLMINIVAPFPGTEFYEIAKEQGWIKNNKYTPTDVQRNSILNYPHLTSKDMESLLFWQNLSYFLSPHFIWHHIRKFRSFADFYHAVRTLKIKLFG